MSNATPLVIVLGAAALGLAVFTSAHASYRFDAASDASLGSRERPIEVILPPELQAGLFHRSLPIAGLLTTPDAIAERVLTNPRQRAPTGQPSTGKGAANSNPESSVAGTHADLID